MAEELFDNPSVHSVHIQLGFKPLLYIVNHIGDYQLAIMEKFPDTQSGQTQEMFFKVPGANTEGLVKAENVSEPQLFWTFKNATGFELTVRPDSILLSSRQHESYNHSDATIRLREVAQHVFDSFFNLIRIPILTRIGMRYIDHCQLPPEDEMDKFNTWYHTTLQVDRFPINSAAELFYSATIERNNDLLLRFQEKLNTKQEDRYLLLDFDGYKENVPRQEYLSITDSIHNMISNEYDQIVLEPAREAMRRP